MTSLRALLLSVLLLGLPSAAAANLGVYAELMYGSLYDDSVELVAYGTAEDYDCLGAVTVDVYLFGPGNNLISSWAKSDWCYASTTTQATLSFSSWADGDYEARATASGVGSHHGCSSHVAPLSKFTAVFQKSHFDSIRNRWVYLKNSAVCNGKCQPSEWCATSEHNWLYVNGIYASLPIGTYCQPIPPYPRPSTSQPACAQPFGINLMGSSDNDC